MYVRFLVNRHMAMGMLLVGGGGGGGRNPKNNMYLFSVCHTGTNSQCYVPAKLPSHPEKPPHQ